MLSEEPVVRRDLILCPCWIANFLPCRYKRTSVFKFLTGARASSAHGSLQMEAPTGRRCPCVGTELRRALLSSAGRQGSKASLS